MEFVNTMRKKGQLIMGIGHRVKSVNDVNLLTQYNVSFKLLTIFIWSRVTLLNVCEIWITCPCYQVHSRLFFKRAIRNNAWKFIEQKTNRYTCIYVINNDYLYIHINTHTYIYIHSYTHIYIYIHIHIYIYIHTYINTYTHVHAIIYVKHGI